MESERRALDRGGVPERVIVDSTLSILNLLCKSMPGKGSCLFSALSGGVPLVRTQFDSAVLETFTPSAIRHDVVDQMRSNEDFYVNFLSEWLEGNRNKLPMHLRGNDAEPIEQFREYLRLMEHSLLHEWGGNPEIHSFVGRFNIGVDVFNFDTGKITKIRHKADTKKNPTKTITVNIPTDPNLLDDNVIRVAHVLGQTHYDLIVPTDAE